MSDGPKRSPQSLPVYWQGGDKKETRQRGRNALVVAPSDADVQTFGDSSAKVCGGCRHFRGPDKDRPEIHGFLARAILEAKWKVGWLADDPHKLGRCAENNELCTGPTTTACDHYSASNGRIR